MFVVRDIVGDKCFVVNTDDGSGNWYLSSDILSIKAGVLGAENDVLYKVSNRSIIRQYVVDRMLNGSCPFGFVFSDSRCSDSCTKLCSIRFISNSEHSKIKCEDKDRVRLTACWLPDESEELIIPYGVTELCIADNDLLVSARRGASGRGLKRVTLPNTLELINRTFINCRCLEEIVIPDSVIILGEECFVGCSRLKSVNIPDSVTYIGGRCFEGCMSLEHISLPAGITHLRDLCFTGCSSLKSIDIPNSVTKIDGGCFSGCTSLESLIIPPNIESLSSRFHKLGSYSVGRILGTEGIHREESSSHKEWTMWSALEGLPESTVVHLPKKFIGNSEVLNSNVVCKVEFY